MNSAPRGLARHWPGLALFAVVLFLYAPELPPGRTFWYRDIASFWSVLADSFVRTLGQGALPLWNPDFSFGMPMLADPGMQTLYPFTWLNLLLPLSVYYKAYVVAHAFLGALGLYRLARRQSLGCPASVLAAVAWLGSGPFQELVSQTHHFSGAALLPWVLLALDTALARPTPRTGLVLGGALALQVLAGSGDLCLMTGFIGAGWTLARLWRAPRAAWLGALRTLGLVAAPFALLLSAAQWLPTLELLRSSGRVGMDPKTNTYWSLHPASLVDLFVPRALSDLPWSDAARAVLYESREPLYACLYLGTAALVLVLFGAAPRRSWLARVGLGGFVLALVAALGRHTPVYLWLIRFTPLAILRYPTKYTIAAAFFWALLCGAAAESWLADGVTAVRRRRAVLVVVALALAAAALALALWRWPGGVLDPWLAEPGGAAASALAGRLGIAALFALATAAALARPRTTPALAALPLLLVTADLARVAQGVNEAGPRELLEYRPAAAARLPPGARLYVSQARPPRWLPEQLARTPVGWPRAWALARGRDEMFWPPLGGRFGYRGSFDGDFTGLGTPLLSNLTLILQGAEGTPLATRLLQAAGVDYVVTADDTAWPQLEPAAEVPSFFRRPIRLLRVPGTRSEVLLVGRARVAGEPDSFHVLGSADFDPARETILASGPAPPAGERPFEAELRGLVRRPDRARVTARTNGPGLLVFLQAFQPGWTAAVDGRPAPVVRADILFMAVAVPEGEHTIELRYRPLSALAGAGLSVAGVLGAVALGLRTRRSAVERPQGAL